MEKLTRLSTIAQALQNPKAVALIEALIPGITSNPAVKMFSRLPLEKITHAEQFGIDDAKLDELLRQVNEE